MRRAQYSAKKVFLPNVSHIGFVELYAKPGHWITWSDGSMRTGRVLGRIECAEYAVGVGTCDVRGWLGVMQLSDDLTHAYVRFVNPEWVVTCYANPPAQLLAWIAGTDWPKSAAEIPRLLAMAEYGTCSESYIAARDDPSKPYNARPEYNLQYVLT